MAHILVVEDNPSNMTLVRLILESMGHAVIEAGNALAGIRLAQTELPDLILMDIQLPGMDGLEATRRLKADPATQAIKVVALTAFAMKGDEERIREGCCEAYISKPISVTMFLDTVKQFIGEAR